MKLTYSIAWLDFLILQQLNPKYSSIHSISIEESRQLLVHINQEAQRIRLHIKQQIFTTKKRSEVRHLIRMYHASFIDLLDGVVENHKSHCENEVSLVVIDQALLKIVEGLLSFIEVRYYSHLSLNQRVSSGYQQRTETELLQRMEQLEKKSKRVFVTSNPISIVIRSLRETMAAETFRKSSYRELVYRKELILALDNCIEDKTDPALYSVVDEVVIGFNFNCRNYVVYLKAMIRKELDQYVHAAEKLQQLLFYSKEFEQLYCSAKKYFDPHEPQLSAVMRTWFEHERRYWKSQESKASKIGEQPNKSLPNIGVNPETKMECNLSTDQIALILRAADEARVVKARSMSQVFKIIVPYLSTPFKKELSYQSVRSKSYNAEDKDKEIAIETLEKIIKKIRSY
ncbi:hypothetical protein ABS764_02580 [Flavobacterium sp. ST-87]|uniref:Uncharacterized protein n=1 Tax=Flavobacterium plantiphilum TaxID=3163297 RepID=A0ABW8XRA0_9FLAO